MNKPLKPYRVIEGQWVWSRGLRCHEMYLSDEIFDALEGGKYHSLIYPTEDAAMKALADAQTKTVDGQIEAIAREAANSSWTTNREKGLPDIIADAIRKAIALKLKSLGFESKEQA